MDNQPPLTSPDGSSHGNPPERCPRPLYSWDSTQEGHTIPHHHQVDRSSYGNPPERCPCPLYSRDSTQEGHTIPHHHQVDGSSNKREPTREMSLSSVFPGFHTGRSHHPSPSSEWKPERS
ncbi:unnamed protein product [Staurois parvus]|uniref:Uncharacterized protein n=1 Tax=Staurois parvus TaxID=386267 RepID=A0ABN9FJA2_9NEOB|nr:unnamed protein product [Staurois parvus]